MMDDKMFVEELRQLVIRRAAAMHLVDTMAFVSEVAERLEEDPVFGEFVQVEYSGQGSRNRQLKVHGFTELDDSDGTIGLVIGKWTDTDEPETLSTVTANQLSSWLENFVHEAVESKLNERIAEVNPAYELASLLREGRTKINRIRLHIFSNQPLSQRFKEELCGSIAGIPMERHIWDLHRLKAMYESSREREAVEISLSDFDSEGIPFIEAARTDKLRSFLCVIEGRLLADLFERYGSRLLEGNLFITTTLFIIAGLISSLGAVDRVQAMVSGIGFIAVSSRETLEVRLLVLIGIFVFAFFKFTWSLRQFTHTDAVCLGADAVHSRKATFALSLSKGDG